MSLRNKKTKNYKDNKSIKKNVVYKTDSVSQYGNQFQKKMYELELKIKQKELDRLIN
jgi:hypothetical protein